MGLKEIFHAITFSHNKFDAVKKLRSLKEQLAHLNFESFLKLKRAYFCVSYESKTNGLQGQHMLSRCQVHLGLRIKNK
jgi:hypothetical protein